MSSTRRLMATISALALVAALAGTTLAGGARHASATFIDATGAAIGWARLVEDGTGRVHVSIHVNGLAPGLHGVHIHAVGACSPTFAAAGGHYNPLAHEHGLDNPNGPHAGDLPNLIVNAAGIGHLDATTDRVTLSPGLATLFDASGSALIIHANPDDQLTDAGNGGSGARIACAVIVEG
jgi:Cu-Zn family superoxide dismutase